MHNPTSGALLFKVKALHASEVFVKPCVGVLAPGEERELKITPKPAPDATQNGHRSNELAVLSCASESPVVDPERPWPSDKPLDPTKVKTDKVSISYDSSASVQFRLAVNRLETHKKSSSEGLLAQAKHFVGNAEEKLKAAKDQQVMSLTAAMFTSKLANRHVRQTHAALKCAAVWRALTAARRAARRALIATNEKHAIDAEIAKEACADAVKRARAKTDDACAALEETKGKLEIERARADASDAEAARAEAETETARAETERCKREAERARAEAAAQDTVATSASAAANSATERAAVANAARDRAEAKSALLDSVVSKLTDSCDALKEELAATEDALEKKTTESASRAKEMAALDAQLHRLSGRLTAMHKNRDAIMERLVFTWDLYDTESAFTRWKDAAERKKELRAMEHRATIAESELLDARAKISVQDTVRAAAVATARRESAAAVELANSTRVAAAERDYEAVRAELRAARDEVREMQEALMKLQGAKVSNVMQNLTRQQDQLSALKGKSAEEKRAAILAAAAGVRSQSSTRAPSRAGSVRGDDSIRGHHGGSVAGMSTGRVIGDRAASPVGSDRVSPMQAAVAGLPRFDDRNEWGASAATPTGGIESAHQRAALILSNKPPSRTGTGTATPVNGSESPLTGTAALFAHAAASAKRGDAAAAPPNFFGGGGASAAEDANVAAAAKATPAPDPWATPLKA